MCKYDIIPGKGMIIQSSNIDVEQKTLDIAFWALAEIEQDIKQYQLWIDAVKVAIPRFKHENRYWIIAVESDKEGMTMTSQWGTPTSPFDEKAFVSVHDKCIRAEIWRMTIPEPDKMFSTYIVLTQAIKEYVESDRVKLLKTMENMKTVHGKFDDPVNSEEQNG